MPTTCEYFDLTRIHSYKAAMDQIHAALPFVIDVAQNPGQGASEEVAPNFEGHVVSGEERSFLFGGANEGTLNLMDLDSYRKTNDSIASAKNVLTDNRVENSTFAGLPEDVIRTSHLVTREEYVFLFGKEPTADLAL